MPVSPNFHVLTLRVCVCVCVCTTGKRTANRESSTFVKNKARQLEVTSVAIPVPRHFSDFQKKRQQRRSSRVGPSFSLMPVWDGVQQLPHMRGCLTHMPSQPSQANPFATQQNVEATAQRRLSRQLEDPSSRRRSQQEQISAQKAADQAAIARQRA